MKDKLEKLDKIATNSAQGIDLRMKLQPEEPLAFKTVQSSSPMNPPRALMCVARDCRHVKYWAILTGKK